MKKKSKVSQMIIFIILILIELVVCVYSHYQFVSTDKSIQSINYLNTALKSVEGAYNQLERVDIYEKIRNISAITLVSTILIMYLCVIKKKNN